MATAQREGEAPADPKQAMATVQREGEAPADPKQAMATANVGRARLLPIPIIAATPHCGHYGAASALRLESNADANYLPGKPELVS